MLKYRKIKMSSEHEPKMLDVRVATDQRFEAVSINEYYITKNQCKLLDEKKYHTKKYHEINQGKTPP